MAGVHAAGSRDSVGMDGVNAAFRLRVDVLCRTGAASVVEIPEDTFYLRVHRQQGSVLVMVILGLIGFSLFSNANARIEVALLNHPIRFLVVIPVFVALIWRTRLYRQSLPSQERAWFLKIVPLLSFSFSISPDRKGE